MDKVPLIVDSYRQSIANTREALELSKVPKSLIELYVTNIPTFENMVPDDAVSIYKEIQTMLILYLYNSAGMSPREISRRLGGSSYMTVRNIIGKYIKKPDVVNPQDVSKPLEVT